MLLKMSTIIDEVWELSVNNKPMNIFISFYRLYGVSATGLNTGGPRVRGEPKLSLTIWLNNHVLLVQHVRGFDS